MVTGSAFPLVNPAPDPQDCGIHQLTQVCPSLSASADTGTALTSIPSDSQRCHSENLLRELTPRWVQETQLICTEETHTQHSHTLRIFPGKQKLSTAQISLTAHSWWKFESSCFDIPAGCCGVNSEVTLKQSVSNSLF